MANWVISDITLGADPQPVSPAGHESVTGTVRVALAQHCRGGGGGGEGESKGGREGERSGEERVREGEREREAARRE